MKRATNLSLRYWNMDTGRLLRLRSQKMGRLQRLERKHMGYFDQMEARKLLGQLKWINTVIEVRAGQLPLSGF